MADIQNTRRKGLETWKDAYESVEKTTDSLQRLNEEFAGFVADYNKFSDSRELRLLDYLDSLGDISEHWEEVNRWIDQNSTELDQYTGSLSNVRDIFKSITDLIGGNRRQIADGYSLARKIENLAQDSIIAVRQEGGLSDTILQRHIRKSQLLADQVKLRVQSLAPVRDLRNLSQADLQILEDKRRQQEELLASAEKELKDTQELGNFPGKRELIRSLQDEIKLRQLNIEYLGVENIKAVTGLEDQLKKRKELWKEQRSGRITNPEDQVNVRSSRSVNVAAKAMGKVGLSDQAKDLQEDYDEWVTARVDAIEKVKQAERELAEARKQNEATLKDLESQLTRSLEGYETRLVEAKDYANSLGINVSKHYERGELSGEKLKAYKQYQDLIKEATKAKYDLEEKISNSKLTGEGEVGRLEKQLSQAQVEKKLVFDKPFELVTQIKKALGDIKGTLTAIAGILAIAMWRQLLKFDEEAVKTKRVIGQWADASALANTKFVTGTEVLKTMRDLGEQFHINPVQVFSSEELGRIAQAQKLTGMSAQAAGNLAVQSKITGKNADTYRDSIAKGANQANRLNHSAVNLSAVQNDVLNTSRAIALSYGRNTEALARAAGSAAALGMNLQDVENISRNLMNFESSIESEMQAQLLTGMQLNLAKAREYALNNDLEGVTREIGRQGMDAAKFSHMNYIQQENMAKALGMSREQMSKMLIMQEINRGLTAEQVAAMTGMRKEDIEALSAQEKWQTMKQRFLESLVPLLEPILQLTTDILIPVTRFVLGPITWLAGLISRIGNLVGENNTTVRGIVGLLTIAIPYIIVKAIGGVNVLGKAFGGIAKLGKKIGTSIASWATGIGKAEGAGGKLKALFSGLGPARDYQGRTARQRLRDIRNLNKAREINPAGATATSRASASMGSTVSKLGKNIGKIATGAAAAALLAGAVFILAKAAKEFEGVSWESMGKAGVAILGLTAAVLALGAIMSSGVGTVMVLAGAAAMVAMAGAVWILGNALKQVTAVPGNELQAIAGGIRAIAGSVGELAVKLKDLQPRKLRALGKAFKNLKGAGIQIQTPIRETEEVAGQVSKAPENTGESKEIKRETIEAAAQSIVIKQAQVQASAQQISVEQKATDLSKIEQKIDRVVTAIRQATPSDWNWLEFNRAYEANT